ncbi:MAG: phage tail protein [Acidobacteriota bacterium]
MTIAELKERSVTETPLLLFECALASGAVERWSTHRVSYSGEVYEARVVRHSVFELRSAAEEGIDAIAKITLILANADSHFSQIERNTGFKGSKVTVRFVFFDVKGGAAASESVVVFQGTANAPDEITEATFRLTAINSLSLQRVLLPEVRVQKRCPWNFPATAAQREEGVTGESRGAYSPFYRCGYSPGVADGVGNLKASEPYASCDRTRAQCEERGMFRQDAAGNPTRRFGGIEFVPATTLVRSHGEKGRHVSQPLENEARYNDFVPLIYGTVWCAPLIVFAKNDGNLTRMEALVGMGEIQGVVKLLVNDIEIPAGQAGANMTATGWYNVISLGGRTGGFNLDYVDAEGNPLGDCYGSMAVLSVVAPNRINDGRSLPRIQALVEGLKLPRFATDGTYLGESFTNNPAWGVLDILRRCGWEPDAIDIESFARAAAYCAAEIETQDLYGNAVRVARFQCNLALRQRRSAAEVIRGIRNGSRLYLTFSAGGRIQVRCENTLALEQPAKPEGSNSREPLNGGWPAYEFGDGSTWFSGILRREEGAPSIRLWSRSTAETPNRFTVEFQDAFNEYQQDSVSLVDVGDALKSGQEVSATLAALGLANFDQAARVVKFHLDKSTQGNTYLELETTVRGFGLKPGDLITVTYLKEGFSRQPFRILKIAPGPNYRTALITAQIHDDGWYSDDAGLGSGAGRRQPGAGVGLPRPLGGSELDAEGMPRFGIVEKFAESTDGRTDVSLEVSFTAPAKPALASVGIPMVSLAAQIATSGGTLKSSQTLYYAVSAVDDSGAESALTFLVRAAIPAGGDTNAVTLAGLSFSAGTAGFHVYRGTRPSDLHRIAENHAPANSFTDTGLANTLAPPPDENYDHANFYWRFELQPEYAANIHSAETIGNTTAQMVTDAYQGMAVRISRGRGAGQERAVVANDATTLVVTPKWEVTPDSTSYFVVGEAGWHFAAVARTSPVEFQVANRVGATVHVTGRAANARDEECAAELSPVTRYQIRGAGAPFDLDVPPKPGFGLAALGGGTVELAGIAFQDLTNTRTITAATLTLHYWNEMNSPSPYLLAASVAGSDEYLDLSAAGGAQADSLVQIDAELMRVVETLNGGLRYRVERGANGSTAAPHAAETAVYHLENSVFIVPLVKDFFGSRASGNFAYPIFLPDVRIASAELFVTNTHGNGEPEALSFTNTFDSGLRTLSGGQISIQVEGDLAIQTKAAPPLVIESWHSVGDIFAVVHDAPTGSAIGLRLKQDQTTYCTLTIPAGQTISNVVNGFGLAPLKADSRLDLDIVAVGSETPGRDLTVTIRL